MNDQRQYTRHIAGELVDEVQRCVVCGLVLVDYRNSFFILGQPRPRGWATGDVYVSGNLSASTPPEDGRFEDCKR